MQGITSGPLLALAVAMIIICTALVTLRLVGRRLRKLAIGADDLLIVCCLIFTLGLCINAIVAIACRLWGFPIQAFEPIPSPPKIQATIPYTLSMKFVFVHEILLPVQLTFAKLSILFFYRRLLCVTRCGFMHWSTLIMAAITALWGVAMFFLFLFQCGPTITPYWSQSLLVEKEACLPSLIEPFMASSDCLLDIVIVALPMRKVFTLNISPRQKMLVAAVFATGGLSVAASLVRVYAFGAALDPSNKDFFKANPNLVLTMTVFWGIFEAGFAIIAACLPSIKWLLDMAVERGSSRTESDSESKEHLQRSPSEFSGGMYDLERTGTMTTVVYAIHEKSR